MPDLLIFILGCLVTALVVLAASLIGIHEGRDVRQLKRQKARRFSKRRGAPRDSFAGTHA